ncbi:MAG: class III signal peptide-containing protein [archaeon]
MNKKAQVSLEFVIVIGIMLLLTIFFSNSIFGTTNVNKSISKVKLRTLDIFSTMDSRAQLDKIDYSVNDSNLSLMLYINRNSEDFNLSDDNYSTTITTLERSTDFNNINLAFIYIN